MVNRCGFHLQVSDIVYPPKTTTKTKSNRPTQKPPGHVARGPTVRNLTNGVVLTLYILLFSSFLMMLNGTSRYQVVVVMNKLPG